MKTILSFFLGLTLCGCASSGPSPFRGPGSPSRAPAEAAADAYWRQPSLGPARHRQSLCLAPGSAPGGSRRRDLSAQERSLRFRELRTLGGRIVPLQTRRYSGLSGRLLQQVVHPPPAARARDLTRSLAQASQNLAEQAAVIRSSVETNRQLQAELRQVLQNNARLSNRVQRLEERLPSTAPQPERN